MIHNLHWKQADKLTV